MLFKAGIYGINESPDVRLVACLGVFLYSEKGVVLDAAAHMNSGKEQQNTIEYRRKYIKNTS